MEASAIDSIQEEFIESFFRGKEKSINREIIGQLVKHKSLSAYTISKRLGKAYSTIHERLNALRREGILESYSTKRSEKNMMMPMYSLSPLGLWVAAHRNMLKAKVRCGQFLSKYWKEFVGVYGLDKISGLESTCRDFEKWLESDEGLFQVLDEFGCTPLKSRVDALTTFRDMMQLSLLTRQECEAKIRLDPDPYKALNSLAMRHEGFRRLNSALKVVNSPLRDHLAKIRQEQRLGSSGSGG